MLGEKALRPPDVVEDGSGTCRRPRPRFKPDGTPHQELRPVCERCWEEIPPYVAAPGGWVSPDSARKLRTVTHEGKAAVEASPRIVCYDCLREDHLECFGVFADIPHEVRA